SLRLVESIVTTGKPPGSWSSPSGPRAWSLASMRLAQRREAHESRNGLQTCATSRAAITTRSRLAEFGLAEILPPFDPLLDADLALLLAARGEEVDALVGDPAQLVGGPAADREILVGEARDDPLDPMMMGVVGVPAPPAVRLEAELLAGDRAQGLERGLLDVALLAGEQLDELGDRRDVADRADRSGRVELARAVGAVELAADHRDRVTKAGLARVGLEHPHSDRAHVCVRIKSQISEGLDGPLVTQLHEHE